MEKRSNLEVLKIIISAWYLYMVNITTKCSESSIKYDEKLLDLIKFITNDTIIPSDLFLSNDEYANQSIEYYKLFKKLSNGIKYTRWKKLSRNPLIRIYGQHFEIYFTNNFNINFLKYTPFLKLTERQFARIFIKIKQKI